MKTVPKWTKQAIKEKLLADNQWLIRGLLAIHSRQTEDERQSGVTVHDNGIGFNGVDAELLSSFAEQYNKYKRLTDRQLEIVRKKLPKYSGQLEKIANGMV